MKVVSIFMAYRIGLFVAKLVSGQFKDISELATALDVLAESAWLEAFEFTPPSIRIDSIRID